MVNTTKQHNFHIPKFGRNKGRTLLAKLTFNTNCRYQFSILKTILYNVNSYKTMNTEYIPIT